MRAQRLRRTRARTHRHSPGRRPSFEYASYAPRLILFIGNRSDGLGNNRAGAFESEDEEEMRSFNRGKRSRPPPTAFLQLSLRPSSRRAL